MGVIKNWPQLGLFNRQNSVHCYYCHGKLKYFKYEAKIKVYKRKPPPLGAVDLNIIVTKCIFIAEWYAKCEKCKAAYIFNPGKKQNYFKKLLPVIDINNDFNSNISRIEAENNNSDTLNISTVTKKVVRKEPDNKITAFNIVFSTLKQLIQFK
jgi:hypothetical protein